MTYTTATSMPDRSEIIDLVKRGKRAKARAQTIKKIVTYQVASALHALIGGWELMLAVGVAHAEWVPALPTIGYWWSVLLVYLLRGTFSVVRPSSKETS
jgi:hypothetical protein